MKEEVVFYENQFILRTWVNEDGVFIKVFPFFLKYKFFSWDTISKAYVRKYNPIWEYGGWGIKFKRGFRIRNIAYSAWGNRGLQLELTDGRRVLIGTCKPVEMDEVLRTLNKYRT